MRYNYLLNILGMIYIGVENKLPKIFLSNYEYHFAVKEKNRTRWRCKNWRKKCKASLYSSGNSVTVYHSHNHPFENVDVSKLTKKLVTVLYK